jgi:hypothetical protein
VGAWQCRESGTLGAVMRMIEAIKRMTNEGSKRPGWVSDLWVMGMSVCAFLLILITHNHSYPGCLYEYK